MIVHIFIHWNKWKFLVLAGSGGVEQGEACLAISAPRGGAHLYPARLRLKTWCKSDLSVAETWPKYLYIHLHLRNFSVFYCRTEASTIIRVSTHNCILHIATVSQEHVLVCKTRNVTRPEYDMVLVLASKLTWLFGGWWGIRVDLISL